MRKSVGVKFPACFKHLTITENNIVRKTNMTFKNISFFYKFVLLGK